MLSSLLQRYDVPESVSSFMNVLMGMVPDYSDGKWVSRCKCKKELSYSETKEGKYICDVCVEAYSLSEKEKGKLVKYVYLREGVLYDTTYSRVDGIVWQSVEEMEEYVSRENLVIRPVYNVSECLWSLNDRFNVVLNVLYSLNQSSVNVSDRLWMSKGRFSNLEMEFLKDNGLYEGYIETQNYVMVHFRMQVMDALNEITSRMSAAGQCLSFS